MSRFYYCTCLKRFGRKALLATHLKNNSGHTAASATTGDEWNKAKAGSTRRNQRLGISVFEVNFGNSDQGSEA